jgi:hypothetical protein
LTNHQCCIAHAHVPEIIYKPQCSAHTDAEIHGILKWPTEGVKRNAFFHTNAVQQHLVITLAISSWYQYRSITHGGAIGMIYMDILVHCTTGSIIVSGKPIVCPKRNTTARRLTHMIKFQNWRSPVHSLHWQCHLSLQICKKQLVETPTLQI